MTARRALRLPDFLIIGAAKSGSSSLFNHLALHPRIYGSEIKEPQFFAYDHLYKRGLQGYSELFRDAREDQLCCEATTDYTRFPQVTGVPERIARDLPDVKLIYIVRHPVDRAYSHYVHRYTKELFPGQPITVDFDQHTESDPMCLDSSLYMLQIEQYLRFFSAKSLLVLSTDDLKGASLRRTLANTCTFLGIDDHSADMLNLPDRLRNETRRFLEGKVKAQLGMRIRNIPVLGSIAGALTPMAVRDRLRTMLLNSAYGARLRRQFTPPPMAMETRLRLIEHFETHNCALESFLGRKFPGWRE